MAASPRRAYEVAFAVTQSISSTGGRGRAYLRFFLAVLYIVLARAVAARGAAGLVFAPWEGLAEQALLVLLLVLGFSSFGFWLDRQEKPMVEQGLPCRSGWGREFASGLAAGWGLAVVCVLFLAIFGGIAVSLTPQLAHWGWFVAELVFFALAALVEEIAFRGYAFQRFAAATGPFGATLFFAAFYAVLQSRIPGASRATVCVALLFSFVLSVAYLRTRALWVSWGINFGWKASRALLFGLAVSGVNSHSPVVQGNPLGSFWLTGGSFGLDASWFVCLLLLGFLPLVFWLTSDLNERYNTPVIVPGGIPVDIDGIARAQHEAAQVPAQPAAAPLVQILPASPVATESLAPPEEKA